MNMFIQRQCKDIIDISKIHFPEQWEYLCRARLYLGQMYLISIASRINAINSYRIQKVKLLIFLISNFFIALGEYKYHRIMHVFKRLWLINMVHHCNEIVDFITTLREHPFEKIISNSITCVG